MAPADDRFPLWTPDGKRIVFHSGRDEGGWNLYSQLADGTGQPERLTQDSHRFGEGIPWSFTRDGKTLIYGDGTDLHLLSMADGYSSKPLVQDQLWQGRPTLSPNGRWIAYGSNETGAYRIHVRPYPNVQEGRWQVPTEVTPTLIWAPNGRELFFVNSDSMAVLPIASEIPLVLAEPRVLFKFIGSYALDAPRNFDISPDGKRFLMIKEAPKAVAALDPKARSELVLVFNWFNELKERAPAENPIH